MQYGYKSIVSILVLVDAALRHCVRYRLIGEEGVVSILVLVDAALRHSVFKTTIG